MNRGTLFTRAASSMFSVPPRFTAQITSCLFCLVWTIEALWMTVSTPRQASVTAALSVMSTRR